MNQSDDIGKILKPWPVLVDRYSAEAWNDYQSELDQLKAYYHENRALIPEKLDLLTNNAIMVGRAILSDALRDERSQDLVSNFRDAKEKCLAEIRKLLAVAVQNDS